MTKPSYEELERLAKAATPGPWGWYRSDPNWLGAWCLETQSFSPTLNVEAVEASDEDRAFIAAANPQTILDLLAELARVRGLLQRAISAANGRWEEWGDRALAVKELLDEATQGAESADIGKLDSADKKGDRCDYRSAAWRCTLPPNHSGGHSPFTDEFTGGEKCPDCQHKLYHHVTEGCAYTVAKNGKTEQCNCGRPRPDYIEKESARVAALPMEERCMAGSAETGGEKAAPDPQLVIACLEEAIELFELDDDVNTPGTDSWLWKVKSEQALIAYAEAEASPNFRQSPELAESGAESVHSGKQNTADKSGLLPTQLPKEK